VWGPEKELVREVGKGESLFPINKVGQSVIGNRNGVEIGGKKRLNVSTSWCLEREVPRKAVHPGKMGRAEAAGKKHPCVARCK